MQSHHQQADGGRKLFPLRLPPSSTNPRTETLDTDPFAIDLPLGLIRVANWIVASRARHILVPNLERRFYGNTQAGVWSDARCCFDSLVSTKYDLQHFDTSFVLITYLGCRTKAPATV